MTLESQVIRDVAILRAGSGFRGAGCPISGCEFSIETLDEITRAYEATKGALFVPVKLGHDEKDGAPAYGWVENVRRVADRLIADLVDVPQRVADMMRGKAYRQRSVELARNYIVGGKTYPWVLTGLALLGADLPAIDGLGDVQFSHRHECGCAGAATEQSYRLRAASGGIQLTDGDLSVIRQMRADIDGFIRERKAEQECEEQGRKDAAKILEEWK